MFTGNRHTSHDAYFIRYVKFHSALPNSHRLKGSGDVSTRRGLELYLATWVAATNRSASGLAGNVTSIFDVLLSLLNLASRCNLGKLLPCSMLLLYTPV